jgi:hypothetical protein
MMMNNTDTLATLGLSIARGAAVALGGAIENGPRYSGKLDADRPGTTTAQAAYVYYDGTPDHADRAIELVCRAAGAL